MASVNISIKRDAYDYLESLKGEDKSFSDVILEIREVNKNRNKDIMRFFGSLKNLDWKKKEKRMKELRASFNRRLG